MRWMTSSRLRLIAAVGLTVAALSACGSSSSSSTRDAARPTTTRAAADHAAKTTARTTATPTPEPVPCSWLSPPQAQAIVGPLRARPHIFDEPGLHIGSCTWMGAAEFLTIRIWTAPVSSQMERNLCSVFVPVPGLGTLACWQPTVHEVDVFSGTHGMAINDIRQSMTRLVALGRTLLPRLAASGA